MKKFVFEITITEDMLVGDEFWELALGKDGTGIADTTELVRAAIKEGVLQSSAAEYDINEVVRLTIFTDKKPESLS